MARAVSLGGLTPPVFVDHDPPSTREGYYYYPATFLLCVGPAPWHSIGAQTASVRIREGRITIAGPVVVPVYEDAAEFDTYVRVVGLTIGLTVVSQPVRKGDTVTLEFTDGLVASISHA